MFNLGLPAYVNDIIYNYSINEAVRRVTIQQRGADSSNALSFYSSVLAALQAIEGVSVPAVLTFGQSATQTYCFGLSSVPSLAAVGKISDWAVGVASIKIGVVGAISDWAVGKVSIPSLAVVAAAT